MQPPPIQIHDAQPVSVATKHDVKELAKLASDGNMTKLINALAIGLALGFIGAAFCGPAMFCAAFGCLAAGVSFGGLMGNTDRSFLDSLAFTVVLLVSLVVVAAGFNRMNQLEKTINNISKPFN